MLVRRRSVLALVVVVSSLLWGARTSAAVAQQLVSVFPTPGSVAWLPQTQIVFRGIPAASIGQVQAVGSQSGAHSGRLEADSDGQGASFIPYQPFVPGEKVTVTSSLDILGASNGSFSFTVATPWGSISPATIPLVPAGSDGIAHFASRPDLEPPAATVTKNTAPATGDIFLAPQEGPAQNGPMILDPTGNLIWFDPLPRNMLATDFRVQRLGNQPVLTWWQGQTSYGTGSGTDVIYNTNYQQIAVVNAADGLQGSDLHEFLLTPQGDAYIVAFEPLRWDHLKRPLLDSVVQEIDVRTGLVLFEWHALDHIPLSESFYKVNSPGRFFDPYHVNSVSLDSDGNVIVSLRNTWAIYKINRQTGAVIWTLGSNRSSFKLGAGAATVFQHDAAADGNGTYSAFDDGAGPPAVHAQSRAVILSLNTATMTATLVRQYVHSPPLSSNYEGNVQLLPGGDAFVGWGQQPYFSEFSPTGRLDFDAHFNAPTNSYRAYRFPWTAEPPTAPAAAAAPGPDGATVLYGSWNGATDVAGWRVLGGPHASSLSAVQSARRTGFETAISIPSADSYYALQALGSTGQVLAATPVVATPAHISLYGRSAFVSTSGVGGLPAGCFAEHPCQVKTAIAAGRTLLASTGAETIGANSGGLLYFTLSHTGRILLARKHRLPVTVSGRDASGLATSASLTLVPFATGGPGPKRSESGSQAVRIIGLTDFVNSHGVGGILTGCFTSPSCSSSTTLTVGATTVGRTGPEYLGTNELGYLMFSLTAAGEDLLDHAPGNQLPVQVTISTGRRSARAQIALVRFT